MAIKKLQNNFTTPEQSKRLLELGVPADSADLYTSLGFENLIWIRIMKKELNEDFFDALINGKSAHIPIWSVGRLIEIFELCTGRKLIRRMDRPIVEDVKCRIAFYIHHHKFDFSKLGE